MITYLKKQVSLLLLLAALFCKPIYGATQEDCDTSRCCKKSKLPSHRSRGSLWINKEDDLIFTDRACVDHPVCVDCPQENEITGWWLNTIKGTQTDTVALWHIFFENNELRAKIYAGYPGRYREWTPEDIISMQSQLGGSGLWGQISFPINEFAVVHDSPTSWLLNPTNPDDPDYLSPQQRTARLNLTTDPNVVYACIYDVAQGYVSSLSNMLRLVRLPNEPAIETYDNPAFIDNTNPIHIFENIFDIQLLAGNPQFATDYMASDYPGFAEFTNRKNQLLTTGASYTSHVKDVWRTRTDDPTFFPFPLSTTLVTFEAPNPRIGARAFVTGFLPPYDILNNEVDGWELGIADNDNGRAGATVYGAEYYDGNQEKFMLTLLDINTSQLPPYDPELHGFASVTIKVNPITANSNYKELCAAIHDLQSFADRSTHSNVRGYYDRRTYRVFTTFDDVQAGLDARTASRFTIRSRGYNGTRSGGAYVDIWTRNLSTTPSIPSNDPTGLSLADSEWENPYSPFFAYNIDGINYLDQNRTYNIYWGLTGPEIPGSPITGERLVDITGGYYKTPGSQFVFTVSDYYGEAPDPSFWTLYGDYQDGFDYRNVLLFGIVDPAYTCGETVAYITLADVVGFDPLYAVASTFNEFTNAASGIPAAVGPITACFASMLKKLNEFSPTSYIINIRGNTGGFFSIPPALASFFGAQRNGVNLLFPYEGNGNQPSILQQNIQNEASFNNLQEAIDYSKTTYNDAVAALYPQAMVRQNGQKVIILTDTNATSNGDTFPHYFRNNEAANPGDIGYGVTSYIVGDIDGRLFGGSPLVALNLFTNASNNLYQNGIAVSAFTSNVESISGFLRAGDNPYIFPNQHPVIAPDILINNDIEAGLWLDVGKVGPYPLNPIDGGIDPLVLPLSTGKTQPVYQDNTTWRDRGLEACIMLSVEDCFSTKSVKHAPKKIKKSNKKIDRKDKQEILAMLTKREEQRDKRRM